MAQKTDRRRADWPEKYADLLGKIPDREVADLAGVGVSSIKKLRLGKGIRFGRRRDRPWNPKDDRLLGKYTDKQAARMLVRDVREITQRRRALGLPPARPGYRL